MRYHYNIKEGRSTRQVAVDDIEWVEGDGNYSNFRLVDGEVIVQSDTLMDHERRLSRTGAFARISKKHLVNINHIKRVNGKDLLLDSGMELEVSPNYASALRRKMHIL